MPCVVVHVSFYLNVKPHKDQMNFFCYVLIHKTYLPSILGCNALHLLISASKQAYKLDEFNSSKSFQRDQQHSGSATGMSRGEALQTAIGKELPVYWHTYSRHTPNLKSWQKSEKAIKDTRWLFNGGGVD